MAVIIKESAPDKMTVEVNNGDFAALEDIIKKWHFKDKESALRYAIAILSLTERGGLVHEKQDGSKTTLIPSEQLLAESK